MANLASALLAFQKERPVLHKDSRAEVPTKKGGTFTYRYLSLEALLEAVLPALNKHGIVLVQKPVLHELGHPCLSTKLIHAPTGEVEEALMPLASALEGPQAQGSAITYARRYALVAFLGLAADDDDGEAAQPKIGTEKKERLSLPRVEELRARLVARSEEADHARAGDLGGTLAEVQKRLALGGVAWEKLTEEAALDVGVTLADWIDQGCPGTFLDYQAVAF